MNYFLQQAINALGWGSLLAMMAAGYTMTFGIIGLVNFAHGEVFMVGALAAYLALVVWKLPFWAGGLAGLIGSVGIGLAIERVAFRTVRGAGMITLFITSLAASFGIRTLFIMLFSDKLKTFPVPPFLKGALLLGELIIFKKTIVIVAVTVAIGLGLLYFVKYTRTGAAMRAMSYDAEIAATMGVNTERVIIATFILASSLAGMAALIWGVKFGSVQCSMGVLIVVDAFIASVLGGIGNVFGAMVAGYIIGVGQTLFVAYLPSELVGLRPLFVWIVFFILLIFKPSGLFRANIK
ncbi:MAG: branched-chain amino acid ABC transporter permease [Desulfobacterales bacterium]|nr:MAG: branched-chain amino acid ABC transporter permease [Desulfobacterales bacterium]